MEWSNFVAVLAVLFGISTTFARTTGLEGVVLEH